MLGIPNPIIGRNTSSPRDEYHAMGFKKDGKVVRGVPPLNRGMYSGLSEMELWLTLGITVGVTRTLWWFGPVLASAAVVIYLNRRFTGVARLGKRSDELPA
jgi:hypothetical protein